MLSHIGSPKVATPVGLRRLPRELHSVAKQASFETPFVRLPIGFWRVLGRFWEVQMDVKLYFSEVFCGAITERVVESNFL